MSQLSVMLWGLSLVGSAAKEIKWPEDVPPLYALFRFDEGSGMDLNNEVCLKNAGAEQCGADEYLKSNKGVVFAQDDHQPGFNETTGKCGADPCHPGEGNWLQDEHFGTVLSCGNGDTMVKDAIRLPDLDYGSTGKFTFNWWMRHNEGHENYDSEYIMTHGAADESTGAPDHIFMFMRGTGLSGGRRRRDGVVDDGELPWIRLNVNDGNEPLYCDGGVGGEHRRRRRGDLVKNCTEGDLPAGNPADDSVCDGTVECWTKPRGPNKKPHPRACCCKTMAEADADYLGKCLTSDGPFGGGTADTNFTVDCALDDNEWHMFTLTTNDNAPGWNFYIDGTLRASNPDVGPGKQLRPDQDHVYAGDPIDPKSTLNLCGRDQWTGWHEHRYFLGKWAHFAILKASVTAAQIKSIFDAYYTQMGFDIHTDCSHYVKPAPTTTLAPATTGAMVGSDGATTGASSATTGASSAESSATTAESISGSVDLKSKVVLDLGVLALTWMVILHPL